MFLAYYLRYVIKTSTFMEHIFLFHIVHVECFLVQGVMMSGRERNCSSKGLFGMLCKVSVVSFDRSRSEVVCTSCSKPFLYSLSCVSARVRCVAHKPDASDAPVSSGGSKVKWSSEASGGGAERHTTARSVAERMQREPVTDDV